MTGSKCKVRLWTLLTTIMLRLAFAAFRHVQADSITASLGTRGCRQLMTTSVRRQGRLRDEVRSERFLVYKVQIASRVDEMEPVPVRGTYKNADESGLMDECAFSAY